MQVAGKLATGKLAMRKEDSRNNYGKTQKYPTKKTHPEIFFSKSQKCRRFRKKVF